MNVATLTLQQVADYLRDGRITRAEVDEYVQLWNDTPGRFTSAERIGDSVVQHDRCGDCGEIRRSHSPAHRFVD